MIPQDITGRLVDDMIRRFRQIPNTDEQELGDRLDDRRTLLEWWVNDFFEDNDIQLIEVENGLVY